MEPYEYMGFTISKDETPSFTTGGRVARGAVFIASGSRGMLHGDSKAEIEKKIRDLLGVDESGRASQDN